MFHIKNPCLMSQAVSGTTTGARSFSLNKQSQKGDVWLRFFWHFFGYFCYFCYFFWPNMFFVHNLFDIRISGEAVRLATGAMQVVKTYR